MILAPGIKSDVAMFVVVAEGGDAIIGEPNACLKIETDGFELEEVGTFVETSIEAKEDRIEEGSFGDERFARGVGC